MPLPREYTPETLLPSSSLFFSLFYSLSSCLLSELCRPLFFMHSTSGCRSDTLDVTAGLFVAVIQDFSFFFFYFNCKMAEGLFDHYSYMSHRLYQKVKLKALCHFLPMMQSSLRFRSTSHMSNFNSSVCCLSKQSFNTNNSKQLVYTSKSAPCVVEKCV